MASKDYYFVLGVSRSDSAQKVRSAFRDLAKRYHPDRAGPQGATFFQEIVEAYQVLSHPEQRRLYNQGLQHAEGEGSEHPEPMQAGYGPAPEPLVPKPTSGLWGFQSFHPAFRSLRERVRQDFERTLPWIAPLEDLDVSVLLLPEEAMSGGILPLSIPVYYPCAMCSGSGQRGVFNCSDCQGYSIVQKNETIRIRIPPMVQTGTSITVPVRGLGLHNFSLRLSIEVAA